jgi:guanylate kinase
MSIVFIVSAPSGSGKSTLVKRLLASVPGLLFSVSYTTRESRGAERPGENYHYVSRQEFEERLGRNEFLEHALVFGNYYGTHMSVVEQARAAGRDLVLDIDVQGARQLKSKIPDSVSVFILPPSREALAARLCSRGEDAREVIERRLQAAAEEIRNYSQYDYVLVNDELSESEANLAAIVRAERLRRSRVEPKIRPILESFDVFSKQRQL